MEKTLARLESELEVAEALVVKYRVAASAKALDDVEAAKAQVDGLRISIDLAKQSLTAAQKTHTAGREMVEDWRHDNESLIFLPEATLELALLSGQSR